MVPEPAVPERPPCVSVIVQTFNWWEDGRIQLGDSLRALGRQTYPDRKSVV